mgnify:CR=1 FL=1
MDLDCFIGLPLDVVTQKLDNLKAKYQVFESSNIQKKYDTLLVVKAVCNRHGVIELTTDKFLLDI